MIPPGQSSNPAFELMDDLVEDLEKAKKMTFRILPTKKGESPYHYTRVHKLFGTGCPICEAGIPAKPVKAVSVKPVERYYYSGIDRASGAAKVMEVSPQVHKRLMQSILGTDQYDKYREKAETEIKSVVPSKKRQYRSIDDDWEGW